ncbi:uncharacterized protein LOC123684190 [Harmonia axyridis]|uniref:uncharacterized protein LOC123684190 n=1 Tax=Harmonia axyridis TaxID=115357 RepID=UPI001E27930B|nr:uncharacterized protein LOC123684190 [Harmonia axyridis]
MILTHLAIISTILQVAYLLPVETNKRDKKRSIDTFLTPFDLEYKPLHISSDTPVSFQETIQFWNSLADGPWNHGIVLTDPSFSGGSENHGHFESFLGEFKEYSDPYLLQGLDAKRAAIVLYSKELFFSDIPHDRALLYNEEKRRLNGLSRNKLGSLRHTSAFFKGYDRSN